MTETTGNRMPNTRLRNEMPSKSSETGDPIIVSRREGIICFFGKQSWETDFRNSTQIRRTVSTQGDSSFHPNFTAMIYSYCSTAALAVQQLHTFILAYVVVDHPIPCTSGSWFVFVCTAAVCCQWYALMYTSHSSARYYTMRVGYRTTNTYGIRLRVTKYTYG